MRNLALLFASLIGIVHLQQNQLSSEWTRVECACEEGDFTCQLGCSGIGSRTGTGSSGTSAFEREPADVRREMREPRDRLPERERPDRNSVEDRGPTREIR